MCVGGEGWGEGGPFEGIIGTRVKTLFMQIEKHRR